MEEFENAPDESVERELGKYSFSIAVFSNADSEIVWTIELVKSTSVKEDEPIKACKSIVWTIEFENVALLNTEQKAKHKFGIVVTCVFEKEISWMFEY